MHRIAAYARARSAHPPRGMELRGALLQTLLVILAWLDGTSHLVQIDRQPPAASSGSSTCGRERADGGYGPQCLSTPWDGLARPPPFLVSLLPRITAVILAAQGGPDRACACAHLSHTNPNGIGSSITHVLVFTRYCACALTGRLGGMQSECCAEPGDRDVGVASGATVSGGVQLFISTLTLQKLFMEVERRASIVQTPTPRALHPTSGAARVAGSEDAPHETAAFAPTVCSPSVSLKRATLNATSASSSQIGRLTTADLAPSLAWSLAVLRRQYSLGGRNAGAQRLSADAAQLMLSAPGEPASQPAPLRAYRALAGWCGFWRCG